MIKSVSFLSYVRPMGKPRMTRRDVWAKRPCVVKYHEYKDRLLADASARYEDIRDLIVKGLEPTSMKIVAFISPPARIRKELTLRKLVEMPCRSKPDIDNVVKGVMDAVFDLERGPFVGSTFNDCEIHDISATKYWTMGSDRMWVEITFA